MLKKSYFCAILLSLLIGVFTLNSCSVVKTTGIDYGSRIDGIADHPTLNVFANQKKEAKLPVLIFVYGGNWNSGNKKTYGYAGRNFAKHDMVVVMPDYTKSPKASYDEMTQQIAKSIQWVKDHITEYGGDPERIYLTGHSAGGHLAALAVMNPKYGVDPKSIKGIILNDAAGLDMESFLRKNPPSTDQNYVATWTKNPEEWVEASPINFIDENTPEIKIYVGDETYESIDTSNKKFLEELKKYQPQASIQWLDKGHVAMVSQLFWPWSSRFDETREFMNKQ
ncbi:alpha/beta hydrolase [Nonlabens marinus]|uniref:Esterase/lipase/thioesterase family protein n=1 Tax=Nonlabens marinus S1-08 TaxID=1454201 RepID=W8VPH5_9FLAO|nr:alpha/beta hydrolase [Nonlabens marinus]BAO54490.1 esterase/lipase/thioesterase family protein [Nonlabens marinus S1-08]